MRCAIRHEEQSALVKDHLCLSSPKFPLYISLFFMPSKLSETIFLHHTNRVILKNRGFCISAGRICVFICSQVTLDWFILLRALHLAPSAPVVCHALKAGLSGSCRVHCDSPVTSEESIAEQRANFKSDCQGDPAAPVITETSLTAHLASTLRYIPQTVMLSDNFPPPPPTQKKIHGISKDRLKCRWEEMIKGKQARHGSKPSISKGFVCKSLVWAETHPLKHSVQLLFDIRARVAALDSSLFFIKGLQQSCRCMNISARTDSKDSIYFFYDKLVCASSIHLWGTFPIMGLKWRKMKSPNERLSKD